MKKISIMMIFTLAILLSACSEKISLEKLKPIDDCNEQRLDGGWVCTWADEFEGDTLDLEKWNYEIDGGGGGNNELQYYTNKNTSVANSILTITAKKEEYMGRSYTSSRITTKYKGDFTYGRFIIRAKNPVGRGTWPAVWMMPTMNSYGIWPKSGEIDIMEYVGYDPTRVHGTIHTERFNHGLGTQLGGSVTLPTANQEFHDYEIIWKPGTITWFVDGDQYYEVNYTPQFTSDSKYNEAFPFDKPFFLILNLAIGGNWGGVQGVDDSIFPAAFEIDFVRVYQLDYASVDKKVPEKVANINKAEVANTIHWQRAFDDYDIEKYAIYVDGKFNGYSNLNQYTLVGLEPNKSYNITVEAIDFVGRTSKISEPFVYKT
ncbi:MAG: family 16 glycosylhydrolase [Paracholeplasma sp.]|nr:family 16 glycosylhydrolase [Paracholeplasma sp.]MDY3195452.1 family 16 glycosylhydrolase [Paracholeplasma sp.]